MTTPKKTIGILGAGAFGTALALVYQKCFNVTLFSCFEDHVNSMKTRGINEFFPNFEIPSDVDIDITDNLANYKFDYILWSFPITPTPEILGKLGKHIDYTDIVICSKGLLPDSSFLYDLFNDNLPNSKISYLSGPNLAIDLASDKYSAADIASKNIEDAIRISKDLSTDRFKLNPIDDLLGMQICGALKNIIAIGSGIIKALDAGQNAYAAFLCIALDEMKQLGIKLGAKEDTFYGLCGLGDLLLTASSSDSRNTSLGMHIGQGEDIESIISKSKSVCEGYSTLSQIIKIARDNNVKLKICEAVYQIVFEKKSPDIILDVFK